jgi:DNA (cytosine-5)-methyltransferase 1
VVVDLFSGIGAGSLGFRRAGFRIAGAVDIDPAASKVYENNFGVKPIVGDLREISGVKILRRFGLRKGEIDVCVGCPPCQAFSSLRSTSLKKGQRDRRKSLVSVFADRVSEMLPKVVVLENVSGLARGRNKRYLTGFTSRMRKLGYRCSYDVLQSADYGTPQLRKRLVLIGTRKGDPSMPIPTHGGAAGLSVRKPWRTVREAISDLPHLKKGENSKEDSLHAAADHSESVMNMIRNIPKDGGDRFDLPRSLWLPCHKRIEEGGRHGRSGRNVYGRMKWDAPGPTVTTRSVTPAGGQFVHPDQNRGITLREAARLQTIPDNFTIEGKKTQVSIWIGNAMPTDLAEAIARHVVQYT